ncbi:MAG TPA: ATP-binding protein [Candidatus Binatia bacterium]|nr:ATP-binding protein [Candidatus Binatia bacterium]
MRRLRLSLRAVVVMGTAATLAGAFAFAGWAALGAAGSDPRGPSPQTTRLAAEAIVVGAAAALVFGMLLAYALGSFLTDQLAALRLGTLERLRGTQRTPVRSAVRDMDALATSIDLLARELQDRAAGLEAERARLDTLLRAVNEGILHLDRNGRVVRANPAACALLGLPPDSIGAPAASVVRDAELRSLLRRAVAGNAIDTSEIALDGRRLLISATTLEDGGAVLAIADLTALRRLEGVRRDFVANVSHELKTPLTSIRGYAETLLSDDHLDPESRRRFLEVIAKNATRLQHIVDDLLDLSRIESGGWRPNLHDVAAAPAVHDAWTGCSETATARAIAFDQVGDARVRADPDALRQILANLFDNAIRHTPEGGRITVAITRHSAADRPPFVEFVVTDTGTGIPGDALPRIFERFYRVDPARSRAGGGTGLGLAIVRHMVETMGGDVTVESALGKGTTMRFRLPAADPLLEVSP